MEYKIGEVSKILNISKEMIRYYEKQGILKPSRKEDNNYRTYSVMDVFLLMEIIRYQSIHFGIKDISELLNEHYLENYAQHLYQYYQEIDQDIIKKILLKERVKELAERIETCKFNLGKYWVKNVPAYQLVFLTNGKGDDYDKLQISIENRNLLFSKERMVYVESMVLFEKGKETWWYGMEERYIESLQLSFKDEKYLKKQLCLCTMIDMGAVLGGRATVGKHCHIGTGAVLAGVIEPASATPVIIEDDVLVGANAVVIEGVHVGKNAVVAAGAVVIDDVPENAVVAGCPARVIKMKDEKATQKTKLEDALRSL